MTVRWAKIHKCTNIWVWSGLLCDIINNNIIMEWKLPCHIPGHQEHWLRSVWMSLMKLITLLPRVKTGALMFTFFFFLWCLKTFQILWFQHDFIVASGDVHVQLLAEWKHDLIVTINTFKLRCIRQKNSSFEWPHWLSHKHPITSGWYYGWLNEEIWLKIFFDSVMAWITTTQKCLEMPVKFPSEFD